jgi:hypothetical protein
MHVTLKLRAGLPSLRSVMLVREIERSFRAGCDRGDFRLVHYSLLSNHAHLIVEAADASALAGGMKAIGSRLARAVNRVLGRRGPVLLERFHLRVLRTPLEVRRVLAYVLLNARRHAARAARALGIDPASSGRWFDGWCRRLRAARGCAPIAAPRTWLLRVGWRRHGLIDPDETPGRPVVHDLPEAVTGERPYFLGLIAPRSGRRREPRSALDDGLDPPPGPRSCGRGRSSKSLRHPRRGSRDASISPMR